MLRFSLFGFPVTIHWMFWLISAMFGGALNASGSDDFKRVAIWMMVVFISILWHELGHAFAFRRYGKRAHIMLHGMGGYAQASGQLTRKQDIIVSLAGPTFGFALGFVVWLAIRAYPQITIGKPFMYSFVSAMLMVNIFWSAVNLLPVLPLDGGRVCAAVVAGGRAGLAPKIGLATAAIVAVLALGSGQIFIAILFGFLGYQNWKMIQGSYGQRPFGM